MMNHQWPILSYQKAKDTYETLHLWTQIVGKIKLMVLPWINHSWHVTLAVTPTGFTTGHLACDNRHFQIDFNFVVHQLQITTSQGEMRQFGLAGLSVADFYKKLFDHLNALAVPVQINVIPCELEKVIPFDQDTTHATYYPEHAEELHKALLEIDRVFTSFRAEFKGKSSPVHFFWGSFDLAVSRFSGRKAPLHPGGIPNLPDWVVQEAYSHEVSSIGFWPGNEAVPFAAFYAYLYPEPEGYKEAAISPPEGHYDQTLGEFVLPYEVVQQAENPDSVLQDFLQSTYKVGAKLADWKIA